MRKGLARVLLRLFGWKLAGSPPQLDRYVLIAAPHTTNWDFPLMLLYAMAYDMKVTWMGKHSLFRPPMGGVMRAMGGIPIVRHEKSNLVESMVDAFTQRAQMILVVPTEGTRARVEYWKSGFYHIARQARVPIVPSFLDFRRKLGGFGPALEMSGNVVQDMQYFRDFYADMKGKFPEKFGPIRLREEDNAEAAGSSD